MSKGTGVVTCANCGAVLFKQWWDWNHRAFDCRACHALTDANGELVAAPPPPGVPSTRGGLNLRPLVPIGLVVLALGAIFYVANQGDSGGGRGGAGDGGGAPAASRAPAAPWWPSDYNAYPSDPSVAWRWMEPNEFNCTYSDGSCWGMEVIARDGCSSSLYVELTILDSSGAAIDYTNDVAGSVTPGQHAKLEFDTFDEDADKARLAEISCY